MSVIGEAGDKGVALTRDHLYPAAPLGIRRSRQDSRVFRIEPLLGVLTSFALPARFELATHGLGNRCSIP